MKKKLLITFIIIAAVIIGLILYFTLTGKPSKADEQAMLGARTITWEEAMIDEVEVGEKVMIQGKLMEHRKETGDYLIKLEDGTTFHVLNSSKKKMSKNEYFRVYGTYQGISKEFDSVSVDAKFVQQLHPLDIQE